MPCCMEVRCFVRIEFALDQSEIIKMSPECRNVLSPFLDILVMLCSNDLLCLSPLL